VAFGQLYEDWYNDLFPQDEDGDVIYPFMRLLNASQEAHDSWTWQRAELPFVEWYITRFNMAIERLEEQGALDEGYADGDKIQLIDPKTFQPLGD
jgi:hypothetical protein